MHKDGAFEIFYEPPLHTLVNEAHERDTEISLVVKKNKNQFFKLGKAKGKQVTSVTRLIKNYFEDFDPKNAVKSMLGRKQGKDWKYFDDAIVSFKTKWEEEGAPANLDVSNDVAVRAFVEAELDSLNSRVKEARKETLRRRNEEKKAQRQLRKQEQAAVRAEQKAKATEKRRLRKEKRRLAREKRAAAAKLKLEIEGKGEAGEEVDGEMLENLRVLEREAETQAAEAQAADEEALKEDERGEKVEEELAEQEKVAEEEEERKDSVEIKASVDKASTSWEHFGAVTKTLSTKWKKEGDVAKKDGLTFHESVEAFYKNDGEFVPYSKELRHFLQWNSTPQARRFVPYRAEWQIFDEDLLLAGTIDMVFLEHKTNNKDVILLDWKRVKHVRMRSDRSGNGPLAELSDCNYTQFSLQLHAYKRILESKYGKRVLGMYVVVCHPRNKSFKEYKIADYPKHVFSIAADLMFEDRRLTLEIQAREAKEAKVVAASRKAEKRRRAKARQQNEPGDIESEVEFLKSMVQVAKKGGNKTAEPTDN